jgi:glycosyltransferase involved in cell wall biosynthesis
VISKDPIVILTVCNNWENYNQIAKQLGQNPVYFFVMPEWTREGKFADWDVEQQARAKVSFPNLNFVTLCSSSREVEILNSKGLQAVLCGHNAFLDPALFKPLGLEKRWDAVCDAQIAPYKCNHLARRIKSLVLVSAPAPKEHYNADYILRIKRDLAHAFWSNVNTTGNYRFLNAEEINTIYNQSKVGLILSGEEGGCYAAIQYLLAGLPVVSTKNIGGRDSFADPSYWTTVDPDECAVEQAAAKFISDPPNPQMVRQKTIEKMMEHRSHFEDEVNRILQSHGKAVRNADAWEKIYLNKMRPPTALWQIPKLLTEFRY